MALFSNIQIFDKIRKGARVVVVPSANAQAVKQWLWRNGYGWKTNRHGKVVEILIDERKSE